MAIRPCGTTLVPRRDPETVEAWRLAFIWLRSLCMAKTLARETSTVVTHELVHGLGVRGDRQQPERVPEPTEGTLCDSELGILFPEATLETTLAAAAARRTAMTTTGTEPRPMISGTRRIRTRLPQQRLALGVRRLARLGE